MRDNQDNVIDSPRTDYISFRLQTKRQKSTKEGDKLKNKIAPYISILSAVATLMLSISVIVQSINLHRLVDYSTELLNQNTELIELIEIIEGGNNHE